VKFQPIASADVAGFVAKAALSKPVNGIIEIAGPDRYPMYEMISRYLQATGDPRKVVANGASRYFGGDIDDTSLVPAGNASLGAISFDKWVASVPRA
jgi:uncharacterized protein YbjT (DUF2867 family)